MNRAGSGGGERGAEKHFGPYGPDSPGESPHDVAARVEDQWTIWRRTVDSRHESGPEAPTYLVTSAVRDSIHPTIHDRWSTGAPCDGGAFTGTPGTVGHDGAAATMGHGR